MLTATASRQSSQVKVKASGIETRLGGHTGSSTQHVVAMDDMLLLPRSADADTSLVETSEAPHAAGIATRRGRDFLDRGHNPCATLSCDPHHAGGRKNQLRASVGVAGILRIVLRHCRHLTVVLPLSGMIWRKSSYGQVTSAPDPGRTNLGGPLDL